MNKNFIENGDKIDYTNDDNLKNSINIDINILKNNIKTAEDFLKYFEENKIKLHDDLNNEYINHIRDFTIIKNYLTTPEISKIFNFNYFQFENSKYINLTANEIITIPIEFNNLFNLEVLILNNNKIKHIENLENLRKLTRLELRSNKIKEFIGLDNKPNLEILSLSCNLLEKIEEDFFPEFGKLKEIGLFGNFLGNDKNMEENMKYFDKLMSVIFKKASNIESIYIGGNHFLHFEQLDLLKKIKNLNFKNLKKLDGQFINY